MMRMVRVVILSFLFLPQGLFAQVALSFLNLGGSLPQSPYDIRMFNCDEDEDLELIVHEFQSPIVLDRIGENQYETIYTFEGRFRTLVTGDLNGDGFDDILGGGEWNTNWDLVIFEATGDGSFILHEMDYNHGTSAELGDIDGDLDLDIVAQINGELVWMENLGGFTFQTHLVDDSYLEYGMLMQALVVEDLDGDGDLDIATYTGEYDKFFTVSINDGSGSYTNSDTNPDGIPILSERSKFISWRDPVSARWTLLLVSNSDDPVRFAQQEDGTWSIDWLDLGEPLGLSDMGDMDGDGRYDLLNNQSSFRAGWYRQLEDGSFVNFPYTRTVEMCSMADYDGDGRLDLFGYGEGGHLCAFINNGPAEPPFSFSLLTPVEDETVPSPVLFQWSSSTVEENWEPVAYTLKVSQLPDLTSPEIMVTLQDTSSTHPLYWDESTYYWSVTARGFSSGLTTPCEEIRSLHTPDLGHFNLLAPADNWFGDLNDGVQLRFAWETSDLAGDSASIQYELHLVEYPDNEANETVIGPMDTTFVDVDMVEHFGQDFIPHDYSWWVVASNEARTTESREVRHLIYRLANVPDADFSAIPDAFTISAVYPNPFNPSTTITVSLPRMGHLTVEVFDLLGRRVATLVDGVHPASSLTIPFHAGELPSAAYYIVASLDGDNSQIAKTVLIK